VTQGGRNSAYQQVWYPLQSGVMRIGPQHHRHLGKRISCSFNETSFPHKCRLLFTCDRDLTVYLYLLLIMCFSSKANFSKSAQQKPINYNAKQLLCQYQIRSSCSCFWAAAATSLSSLATSASVSVRVCDAIRKRSVICRCDASPGR
jgi:hypothetical protein